MPETEGLALFPLKSVLFPGALLSLKVFEPRYLDLVSACMRESKPFGVVLEQQGLDKSTGTLAHLVDVRAFMANILHVRCHGGQRFCIHAKTQQANGLWQATVSYQMDDAVVLPPPHLVPTAQALASAIINLKQKGQEPFLKPFHFENAGWVANRWCEILPIPLLAKQQLLALPDPLVRLQLVSDFLRGQEVVG